MARACQHLSVLFVFFSKTSRHVIYVTLIIKSCLPIIISTCAARTMRSSRICVLAPECHCLRPWYIVGAFLRSHLLGTGKYRTVTSVNVLPAYLDVPCRRILGTFFFFLNDEGSIELEKFSLCMHVIKNDQKDNCAVRGTCSNHSP